MRLLQLAFVVALASGFAAIFIYITGVSNLRMYIILPSCIYTRLYMFLCVMKEIVNR